MITTEHQGFNIRTDEDGEVYLYNDAEHSWGSCGELNLSGRAALVALHEAIGRHLVA